MKISQNFSVGSFPLIADMAIFLINIFQDLEVKLFESSFPVVSTADFKELLMI